MSLFLAGEASKQIHEYKLKLQKAEQDIATLEGSVSIACFSGALVSVEDLVCVDIFVIVGDL